MGEPLARHPQQDLQLRTDATFDMRREVAADGTPRLVMGRRPEVVDHRGAIPLGALALLVDSALGTRLMPLVEADDRLITSHMHFEMMRAITPDVTEVVSAGEVVSVGDGSAFARVTLTSGSGTLLGVASGRFAVLSATSLGGGTVLPAHRPQADRPDDQAGDDDDDGPTGLGRESHHLVADASVHRLLGTRVHELGDGLIRLSIEAGAPLANERSGLHGGVGALVGERANDLVLRSLLGPDRTMRSIEMRVAFVRPLPASGRRVECVAQVVNLGRTVAVTRAELRTEDGKPAVLVDQIHVAG